MFFNEFNFCQLRLDPTEFRQRKVKLKQQTYGTLRIAIISTVSTAIWYKLSIPAIRNLSNYEPGLIKLNKTSNVF